MDGWLGELEHEQEDEETMVHYHARYEDYLFYAPGSCGGYQYRSLLLLLLLLLPHRQMMNIYFPYVVWI